MEKVVIMKGHLLIQAVSHILFWSIALYLAYCALLFLFQRQMLFPGTQMGIPPEELKKAPGLERVQLETRYGRVEAWFMPAVSNGEKKPAPAVVFAHGNGEVIDFWPEELRRFTRLGMGVFLVEYPGYGRSEGKPSQRSIRNTFITAYDILVQREDVDASQIILFGRSIGGGAVCTLAAERPSAAMILMSTFTSIRSFAPSYFIPGFLVLDPFDNLRVIRSYPHPVLVLHGEQDELIPYKHGVALARAAPRGKLITYRCGHNDCPPTWDIFWRDVEAFLRENGILTPNPYEEH